MAFISKNKTLEILSMAVMNVKPEHAYSLALTSSKLPVVNIIALARIQMKDDGARALAQYLEKLQNLKILDLHDNRITRGNDIPDFSDGETPAPKYPCLESEQPSA